MVGAQAWITVTLNDSSLLLQQHYFIFFMADSYSSVGEDLEKKEHLHTVGGNAK